MSGECRVTLADLLHHICVYSVLYGVFIFAAFCKNSTKLVSQGVRILELGGACGVRGGPVA